MYSHLNWRLVGSLLLEVTFEGETTFPSTPQPTYSTDIATNNTEPTDLEDGSQSETDENEENKEEEQSNERVQEKEEASVSSFHLYKEAIEVTMHAQFMKNVDESEQYETTETATMGLEEKSQLVEFDGETWVKINELTATRKLQCTYAHSLRKYNSCIVSITLLCVC